MRQVPRDAGRPVKHLLIGSGRLSRHFTHYFRDLGIDHETWLHPRVFTREVFQRTDFTHVWFLVSDRAIDSVGERWLGGVREFSQPSAEDFLPQLLHASGSWVTPVARGAHPLMTFGPSLYPANFYRDIPFIVEDFFDGVETEWILGGLPNRTVQIPSEKKALYHALVSSAGNFPAMLWADVFTRFERDLGISHHLLAPYLFQTLANVLREGEGSLTGPLIRGDRETIVKHKGVLEDSPLGRLYAAFEIFFRETLSHHPEDSNHV
ncbi:MAG: DUF2520 domain-containing protein [Cryobacterium sp.]|nr:DUF2520 domain-containing protein [Oligoflexia bacterium]